MRLSKYKLLGGLCNIGYLSETHLKPKSREISFAHNLSVSYAIILKISTDHGSDTVKLQNDWATKTDKRDFARFEFEVSFRTDVRY